MNPRYEQSVELAKLGIALEESAQWMIGDATLSGLKFLMGPKVGPTNIETLSRWVRDIGWQGSRQTLINLRDTSRCWPTRRRVEAAWSVHFLLRGKPQRFEIIRPGMTVTEVRQILGYSNNNREAMANFLDVETGLRRSEAVLSWARSMARCDWSQATEEQLERYGDFRNELDVVIESVDDAAGMLGDMPLGS